MCGATGNEEHLGADVEGEPSATVTHLYDGVPVAGGERVLEWWLSQLYIPEIVVGSHQPTQHPHT